MADRFQIQNRKQELSHADPTTGDPVYRGWHWILIGDDDDNAGVYLAQAGRNGGFEKLSDLLEFQRKKYPDAVVEGIGDDEPELLEKPKRSKK
jgi:hypothetical protein